MIKRASLIFCFIMVLVSVPLSADTQVEADWQCELMPGQDWLHGYEVAEIIK